MKQYYPILKLAIDHFSNSEYRDDRLIKLQLNTFNCYLEYTECPIKQDNVTIYKDGSRLILSYCDDYLVGTRIYSLTNLTLIRRIDLIERSYESKLIDYTVGSKRMVITVNDTVTISKGKHTRNIKRSKISEIDLDDTYGYLKRLKTRKLLKSSRREVMFYTPESEECSIL